MLKLGNGGGLYFTLLVAAKASCDFFFLADCVEHDEHECVLKLGALNSSEKSRIRGTGNG